jgi:hypothetical protein
VVKEIPIMNKVCMQFYFENSPKGKDPTSLIFVKQDRVIKVNYEENSIDTINEFENPLMR